MRSDSEVPQEAGHIKGKWFVHKYKKVGYAKYPSLCIKSDIISSRGNPSFIAMLGTGTPERLANAQLIAAAPKLLEACKDLISYLSGRNTEDWEIIDERARLAIAKAEE